jgi:hypothetical protein
MRNRPQPFRSSFPAAADRALGRTACASGRGRVEAAAGAVAHSEIAGLL